MFKIRSSTIEITQGDTGRFAVPLFDENGQAYQPLAGDVLRFTVKANLADKEPLVQKVADSFSEGEAAQFVLHPADTAALAPGKYIYDVELTQAGGDVSTVVTPHDFYVLGGVS